MRSSLGSSLGLPGLALLLSGTYASASGFQLREQSPSAQGNAFAGITAGGDDIGAMFFNSAILTRFQGNEVVAGFSFIAPSARLEQGSASRASIFPAPLRPVGGSPDGGDAGKPAALPVVYALWSLSPDLKLGFSLNCPFGLTSSYEDGWIGRYHALESAMTVVEVAPNLAWRAGGGWSIGAAIVARHVDAKLTNAVDFGAIGAALGVPGSVPGKQDGTVEVSGKQWKLGYRLGVLFEPTSTFRIGAAYHSAIDFRLKGEVHYQGVPAVMASRFPDGGAVPIASQPATASMGAAWDVTSALTLQAEAARTFWGRFKEIRIAFLTGQADSVTDEHWKDSWFTSVGLTWRKNPQWTFRTGIGLDGSPATDTYRTPRIPDGNRTWLSVGAGYAFSRSLSLDLGLSHILVQEAKLALKSGAPGGPDFFRGNLEGRYRSAIDILALQARYRF